MAFSFISVPWFDLLQSAFIAGSFLLAAISYQNETRSRQISHLFTLHEHRQAVWRPMLSQPELARIRQSNIDLTADPITTQEQIMVKMAISHLYLIFKATETKQIPTPPGIQLDIKQYFSLPIPNQVWQEVKPYQDSEFIRFISDALALS